MTKHYAWTANVPGVGELEERDPGDYVGTHRQTTFEGYLQSEHLQWLLAGKPMEMEY